MPEFGGKTDTVNVWYRSYWHKKEKNILKKGLKPDTEYTMYMHNTWMPVLGNCPNWEEEALDHPVRQQIYSKVTDSTGYMEWSTTMAGKETVDSTIDDIGVNLHSRVLSFNTPYHYLSMEEAGETIACCSIFRATKTNFKKYGKKWGIDFLAHLA